MNITPPTGLTVVDWAKQLASDVRAQGLIGTLDDPECWQDWGVQLANNVTIGNTIPNPYQFTDWKDWAERVVQVLN